MVVDNAINIYTDGSGRSHPRTGGIGFRIVVVNTSGDEECDNFSLPGYPGATNNQMELKACIEGIKQAIRSPEFENYNRIVVFSDSRYVIDNEPRAFWAWSKNGWCNADGKPVDNAELWDELLHIIKRCQRCQKRVEFRWVKGHFKDQHNKAADGLARQSSKVTLNSPISVTNVRRKLSGRSVDPGCVPVKGQRIFVRIIEDQYLPLQRHFKYRYEVISKGNQYRGYVDFIHSASDIMLNAGHCYSVRLNDNPKKPMIIKVYKELEKRKI